MPAQKDIFDIMRADTAMHPYLRAWYNRCRDTFIAEEEIPATLRKLLFPVREGDLQGDEVERAAILVIAETPAGVVRILGHQVVAIGSINHVPLDYGTIFRWLLRHRTATSFVIGHNHPTGRAKPSPGDLELRDELVRLGELLRVSLRGFYIVTATDAVDALPVPHDASRPGYGTWDGLSFEAQTVLHQVGADPLGGIGGPVEMHFNPTVGELLAMGLLEMVAVEGQIPRVRLSVRGFAELYEKEEKA